MRQPIQAQEIGDLCHEVQRDAQELLVKLSALQGKSVQFAIQNGVSAKDSQRPIARLTAAIEKTTTTSEMVMVAHMAMQSIAEEATFPFDCPPNEAQADNVTHLKVANG